MSRDDSGGGGGGCLLLIIVVSFLGALAYGYDIDAAAVLGLQAGAAVCMSIPALIVGVILLGLFIAGFSYAWDWWHNPGWRAHVDEDDEP